MKRLFILCLFIGIISPKPRHAFSYTIESWRRLGDAITTVSKMFYFAHTYQNKFTLYFRDFPYFNQFTLSKNAQMLTPQIEGTFSKKIVVQSAKDIEENLASKQPILFECHFLSETPPLYYLTREYPDLGAVVKKAFTPLIPIQSLAKPPAVITVGLHVRKGGGFDKPLGSQQEYGSVHELPEGFYLKKNSPPGSHLDAWPIKLPPGPLFIEAVKHYMYKKNHFSDYIWPIKFPCDQYYIDCLKELAGMLPDKNLLVYLFTDDPEPEDIMMRYSAQLKDYPRIIFSYREKDNHHSKNVIEDLFALTECDCLISASSSFASAAQLLGNHQVLIFPLKAITFPNKIVINKVGVIVQKANEQNSTKKIIYHEIVHNIG